MTFRARLLASIVGVVTATTAATLFIAQSQNTASYQAVLDELFRSEVESFRSQQEQQLTSAKTEAAKLAESVRLFAALEEGDPEVYQTAGDELRLAELAFFRLTDAAGVIIPPPEGSRAGGHELDAMLAPQLAKIAGGEPLSNEDLQIGFVASQNYEGGVVSLVYCPIRNFDKTVGGLLIGQPLRREKRAEATKGASLISGLLLGEKYLPHFGGEELGSDAGAMLKAHVDGGEGALPTWEQELGGRNYRADSNLMNRGSRFAPAWIVSLYPLDDLRRRQRELVRRIAVIGGIGLLAAAGVGFVFAGRLSKPVHDLVAGTAEVKRGNYDVQIEKRTDDELGALADAFNEMASGLALKERYRSVLQMVTDRSVADELMSGTVLLGGEMRDVSVIFCDIRGFTAISQDMNPADVVVMLNEHMSALTQIVEKHQGVVDKFVGDCIMILFGAPKSYGHDAARAARCAWKMIRERERMNATSNRPLAIGIGLASGPALAGCMGSEKRLNYTVIGERVNLAARLCSQAGQMDVVIDETTLADLPPEFKTESLGPLTLKGFAKPVVAHRILKVVS